MITSITNIGNSKGFIIPAQILKQCNFDDKVSLEIKNDALIISKIKKPRENWEEAFASNGGEEAIMDEFSNDFDESEWTW